MLDLISIVRELLILAGYISSGKTFPKPLTKEEDGIPAAILYISALAVHFVKSIRFRKSSSMLMIGLLCCIIAYLGSSIFGNTMYYTTPFFIMVLGLCIPVRKNENHNPKCADQRGAYSDSYPNNDYSHQYHLFLYAYI